MGCGFCAHRCGVERNIISSLRAVLLGENSGQSILQPALYSFPMDPVTVSQLEW